MSLLAEQQTIAQEASADLDRFAVPVTLRDTLGREYEIEALVTDIAATVDPETGMVATSRKISIVLGDAAVSAAGMPDPVALPGNDSVRPWLARYAGGLWRVTDVRPDRTFGLRTLFLERYNGT